MPKYPDTDRFGGIEETKDGLVLRWISADNPKFFLESAKQFKDQLAVLKGSGKPLTQQIQLAEMSLESYEMKA